MSALPVCHTDIYSDAEILEPYGTYAVLRDMGPVVHLPSYDLYALARHKDVRKAAIDYRTFSSASGVAANPLVNGMSGANEVKATIASDPPQHNVLRRIVGAPLLPQAIAKLESTIQAAANELVERLVAMGSFDGATDFARHLPLLIVSRLVGLPDDGRQTMLDWAAATFDVLGPMNARGQAALPRFGEMMTYIAERAQPSAVAPGSWAAKLFEAADAGEVTAQQATAMLVDYLGPSLDTTIFATGHMLHLFAQNPAQWARLREDPTLIANAIEECVRIESPIRGFTRLTTDDVEIDGTPLPAGTRVLLLYASANRDERRWNEPDRFDIGRDTSGHMGFGAGRHACAGMHLAKVEITCLMRAMLASVKSFEADEPVRAVNNLLRGLSSLPVTVTTLV